MQTEPTTGPSAIVGSRLGARGRLGLVGAELRRWPARPVQPYLAAASILLLGWAFYARVTRENSCRLPRTGRAGAVPAVAGQAAEPAAESTVVADRAR